jgi:hypothetical protein
MAKPIDPDIRIECKRMFVLEGKTSKAISEYFDGIPTHQCITRWSHMKNRDGLTWIDERAQYQIDKFEMISPAGLASKILRKINKFMNKSDEDFNVKDADALSKLRVSLEKITDKKYQIPIMFQVLTDLVLFLKKHYPDLNQKVYINAIRHFKNTLSERLNG